MYRSYLAVAFGLPAVCLLQVGIVGPRSAAHAQDATLVRGDADGNGDRQITDAILVLNYLFTGGRAPVCSPLADTNADGDVNISDPVTLLGHLFLGNPTPPALSDEEIAVCNGVDPAAVARGMKEFENADANGNLFSCSTCHSMAPDEGAEVIRSGHTLLNSLGRPNFKDGAAASFLAAVNVCRNDWMVVGDPENNFEFTPWLDSDSRFKDLVTFIKSLQTSDSSPALEFEIVAPAKSGPTQGDAAAGCKLFNRSCMVCHGMDAKGTSLAPSLIDVTSLCDQKPDLCLNANCDPSPAGCLDNPDYLRNRIRLSGPDHPGQIYHVPDGSKLAGTVMPFWAKDKLSDSDVEDLTAYMLAARSAVREGKELNCDTQPNPDGNVVRSGKLEGLFHGVKGTAEELDTHKIRLTQFSYDGGGIEVRVWLYKGTNPRNGRAIGPDIFGQAMSNKTFIVEIPVEITSDSFDHVSIWCVSARQDFGHAELKAAQ